MLNPYDASAIRYDAEKRSGTVYLLLAFFLGVFGAHRFYLGQTSTGLVMLLLTLTGVGLIITIPWVILDMFRTGGMIASRNRQVAEKIIREAGR